MSVVPPFLAMWLLQLALLHGAVRSEAVCGQKESPARIVTGQPAKGGGWPWQVSIMVAGKHDCGASLIAEQWLVTAAHCLKKPIGSYDVVMGAYQLQNFSEDKKYSTMKQSVFHSNYKGYVGSSGDIALVELTSPVNFTNKILPICLPDNSTEFPYKNCWVTGWGQVRKDVNLGYPQTLQELEVPILDRDSCNLLFNMHAKPDDEPDPIKKDMFCAGYQEGKKDACQGDSGGPLVCLCDKTWFLAGVVSWGEGCAEPNRPGVYASMPYYADWISEKIPNMTFVTCKNGGGVGAGRNVGLQKIFPLLLFLEWLTFALL